MNILRSIGDLLHLAAITILLAKMLRQRTSAGVSLKSMFLFALVFATRYLDLFVVYISMYNTVMKILYLSSSSYICYLMKFKSPWKSTYDSAGDSFKIRYLIVPCLLISFVLSLQTSYRRYGLLIDSFRVFSLLLESVAILPQIFLLEITERYDVVTTHYLVCLGLYRLFYIGHWMVNKYFFSRYKTLSLVCGIVQTILYADFFVQYVKVAWIRVRRTLDK